MALHQARSASSSACVGASSGRLIKEREDVARVAQLARFRRLIFFFSPLSSAFSFFISSLSLLPFSPSPLLSLASFNHPSEARSSCCRSVRGGGVAACQQARAFRVDDSVFFFCSSLLPSARRRRRRFGAADHHRLCCRSRQEGGRLPAARDDRRAPGSRQGHAVPEDCRKGKNLERELRRRRRPCPKRKTQKNSTSTSTLNIIILKNKSTTVWPRPHLCGRPPPRRGRRRHARRRPGQGAHGRRAARAQLRRRRHGEIATRPK